MQGGDAIPTMSAVLAATLAASMTLPTCSWDRPGANPFMGDVVAAVDRYTDIPEPVRAKLKARMEARQYDEIAAIRRDSVTGKRKYASEIRDMHFGQGTVCRTVTRAKWADDTVERGLVYCESGHCIIVPTVCRNVSRIKRLGGERVASAGDEPLLAPEGMGARSGSGDGFGGGGTFGGGDTPLLALNTAPGPATSSGGDAGGASFQSLSGPRILSVPTADIGGGGVPPSPSPQGSTGDGSIPWSIGAGSGGGVTGPVAGVGTIGSLGGGGGDSGTPGSAGTPGNSDGSPSPAPPPGLGGAPDPGTIGPARIPAISDAAPIVSDIPEPGTWALFLLGLAGLARAARKR